MIFSSGVGVALFLFGVLNFFTVPVIIMMKYGIDEDGAERFLMETPMEKIFILSAMMHTAPLFIIASFFVPRLS